MKQSFPTTLHYTFLTTILFSIYACKNSSIDSPPKTDPIKKDSVINVKSIPDTVTNVVKKEIQEKKVSTAKRKETQKPTIDTIVSKIVVAPEMPDKKMYFENERDDPNYVGTPCKYISGECINHNHRK